MEKSNSESESEDMNKVDSTDIDWHRLNRVTNAKTDLD